MEIVSTDDWVTVVEALYHYESTNARGHSVIVQPGELYYLIRDIDEDWWFVGRSQNDEDGFYFPHTYGKVMQRQLHRMSNKDTVPISANMVNSFTSSTNSNHRLSTFGDGGSLKRRSYQLATIIDNHDGAIYDNPVALNSSSSGLDASRLAETAAQAANSLLRRKTRGPGFKLADPNRISRSIPVDLNFVHHIPNEEDEENARAVSFYGDSTLTGVKNGPELPQNEAETEAKTGQAQRSASRTVIDGPIYANMKPIGAKELPPLPVPGSDPINILHDGWAEYVDKNNRHYFYNAKSKKAMWKPPRFGGVSGKPGITAQSSVSSGDELDTSFVSDDGDAFAPSRDAALSSSVISTCDSSLECTVSSSICAGHSSTSSPVPLVDIRTLPVKKCFECPAETNGDVRSNHDATSNREADVYSYSEDLANIATKMRSSTEEQSPTTEQPNSIIGKGPMLGHGQVQQNFVRYGVLNRCKYMEAGKRVKKQWLPCFVYLTNAHLIFYKDEKAAEKKGNQYPTPLGVCDLRGSKLRWLEGDVSRRKNVFQVQLMDSTVYLFHAENQPEISRWFDDLRQVIDQLPVPDCYPTPAIETNSTRFSMRKGSTSKSSTTRPDIPKLPAAVASPTKDIDKRKSVSFSQPPPIPPATAEAMEHSIQKETILEKLRKFFRHRPSVETLKERGIYKPEPVFGSSLMEICRREKTTVPKFIVTCTALIEEKGLSADGLYRINGNLSQVQRIRCQVDQEKYGSLLNETDVHVLTGALKLFFRELQEPAFPTSSTKEFLNAIKLQNSKQRWKAFSELVVKLPRPHHDTLDHLFQHLLNVAKQASKNRMQIHNLAIVFGPSLFSSNPSAKSSLDLSKNKTKKKTDAKTCSSKDSTSAGANNSHKFGPAGHPTDVTHSNSQMAFTMILQGQIVEYMLKEHARLFKPNAPIE